MKRAALPLCKNSGVFYLNYRATWHSLGGACSHDTLSTTINICCSRAGMHITSLMPSSKNHYKATLKNTNITGDTVCVVITLPSLVLVGKSCIKRHSAWPILEGQFLGSHLDALICNEINASAHYIKFAIGTQQAKIIIDFTNN